MGKQLTGAPELQADSAESQALHPLLTLPLGSPLTTVLSMTTAPPTGCMRELGSQQVTLRQDEEANTQERGCQTAMGPHPHIGLI